MTGRLPEILMAVVTFAAISPLAHAQDGGNRGDRWLEDLQAEIASDLARGKPLVVHVHVPLCDNDIIPCGARGRGDGDDPDRNLYWATGGGFRGWFGRPDSKWTAALVKSGTGDIVETRVWRRRFQPRRGLAAAGKPFDVYVIATAWRGKKIRAAMDTYTRHLYGGDVEWITTADGTRLAGGGAAHVVAFVGHNGWMDVDRYDFAEIARGAKTASKRIKGTIAIACITEDYLSPQVSSASRVPLLMTRWLLFAGAHGFEGAVTALAEGRDLAGIRWAAVRAYARGQRKSPRRVSGGFTNPAYKRWKPVKDEAAIRSSR